MKISYLTNYEPSDIHKWSGLGFYISKALKDQGNEMEFINNLGIQEGIFSKFKRKYYKSLGKNYQYIRTVRYAEEFAQKANTKISVNADIIFSPGSIPLSLLETNKPKVIYTDATFNGILNFYKNYSNVCKENIEQGQYLERKALDSVSLAIYSSEWAAETAIKNYSVNPGKVRVVPFGANIDSYRSLDDIKSIISSKVKDHCNLLFVGVDWYRKGGDLALKVAQELNNRGLKTELHVAGIKNFNVKDLPGFVINHGFLSKSDNESSDYLNRLYTQSHFLIVPSRAEAYGLVFAEASSFGLPSLATTVGGIPTVVKNNVNGMTFPLSGDEKDYADFIMAHFSNYDSYKQLSFSSFNEFEKRLNWRVAGETIQKLLKEL